MRITMKISAVKRTFWMQDKGGYLFEEFGDRVGVLGEQLRIEGNCLSATPETFKSVLQKYANRERRLDRLLSYWES